VSKTIKATICLSFVLLLTSCSSGPSLEDQKKIIEYDNCLEFKIAEMNRLTSSSGTSNKLNPYLPENYSFSHQYQNYGDYSEILSECSSYLP